MAESAEKVQSASVKKVLESAQRSESAEYRDAVAKLIEYDFRHEDLSVEEVIAKAKRVTEAEATSAQVLSRGRTLDSIDRILKKYVPEGMVGEFARNNDLDIARYRALGYEVFVDEDAKGKKETPTGTADGLVRLGDTILMTIPEETYRVINRQKARRRAEKRRKTDSRALARAERMKSNLPIEEM